MELKALEAVGNSIDRFLCIDKVTLKSDDKRMENILVEVDVHAGLMEVLEIEWWGLVFMQHLDYLGIPFHCTLCRQTGHLRKECNNIYDSLVDDDSMEEIPIDPITPIDEDSDPLDYPRLCSEDIPTAQDTSFVGISVLDNRKITLLNVYGPCQDRKGFWDSLDGSGLLAHKDLVIVGDLNFTTSAEEVWGLSRHVDSLTGFFIALFLKNRFVDIMLAEVVPTWRNGRSGNDSIEKILDHFYAA
jgi:hypothetical protein